MLRLYFIFGYQYSNYIFCSTLGLQFSGMFQIQPRRLSMQKMMGKFSLSLLVCLSCHLLVRRIIFQRSPPHALSRRKNDQLADFFAHTMDDISVGLLNDVALCTYLCSY